MIQYCVLEEFQHVEKSKYQQFKKKNNNKIKYTI